MKKIAVFLLSTLLLAGLFVGCGEATPDVETTAATTLPPADKLIALTFDDGPEVSMGTILDALEEYNAKATFFVIGSQINAQTSPYILQAYEQGHEIGNHTYSHADLTTLTPEEIEHQVSETQRLVKKITGEEPVWIRPPFLATNPVTFQCIDMPHAGCAVNIGDGADSNSAQERYERIIGGAYDGAIVLLHCNHTTASVLPDILKELRRQSYEFVTVSQLFSRVGEVPDGSADKMFLDNRS